ncbi:MAG TPA: carbon-nitrogen hydrolase family protein [Thermoanaerobaculia bacterium]|nr:carbon-nitrogen hydrolase family protein [Thermoanaerobaculia bacterium]HUM29223.1 carbon-nitrogen hydrolase family protein [Thermoanaerobaculia bacterium]HXK67818.1 carbon-nitrogen hydrolase family protein [Thermoanaerobaculia bacterium]
MPKLAIIQQSPFYLDKQATMERAIQWIEEAVDHGATLIIFPETFFPGYPAWIWRLRPGSDWDLTGEIYDRLLRHAVSLSSDDLNPMRQMSKDHAVTVVCGIHERDARFGRTTLYNTVVIIGADGSIQNRHRKLMPTNPERMVWGMGDASGLRVVDTPCGRMGGLICWENYMPLARYALYAQGVEVYIAPTYDSGDGWIGTLQHIAREGRCWVVGSGTPLKGSDFPEDFPGKDILYPDADEWVNPGDSVVVAPGGEIVAGPLRNEHAILYADFDPDRVGSARRALDVTGHYSRPDIFDLHVHTQPLNPITMK